MSLTDIKVERQALADPRGFTADGAGQRRRAALTDVALRYLRDLWAEAVRGSRVEGIALGCVGSLGRGDLGPLSDYDLVLLHRGPGDKEVKALADRLWYPLWDSGVRFDHSVRTLAQCRDAAGRDLSAAVGLLDIAHIAGDETFVAAVRSTTAHDWRRNARTRLPELADSVRARHEREGDLSQLVDPDLKEAKGGLRDMGILRALTAAWLTDRPHGDVDAAYAQLLDVRDALHVVTGRPREKLAREEHDSVAAVLGFADGDEMLSAVSASARVIAYALDGTVRRASQSREARSLRISARRPQLTPLGHGLHLHDHEVVMGPGVDVARDPLLPMRAALAAARAGVTIAPRTLDNLAANSRPIPTPWSQSARDVFSDLLATGPALLPVWEGLDLAGLVTRWIPAWRAVRSRPQRSPVHRHTVDRHSIEAVVLASEFLRDARRPDLFLIAVLLHDIGKIAGAHDHSVVGARIAGEIAAQLGYEGSDRDTIVRLVREHLTLMDLATHRDVTDSATIAQVVQAAGGNEECLVMLRDLSESDARAVGAVAWTSWRARLLNQLTESALTSIRGYGRAEAVAVDDTLDDLAQSAKAEVEQTRDPYVHVDDIGDGYAVLVADWDRKGLFADLAGWFSAHSFAVRSAILRTVDEVALDQWLVTAPGGDAPDAEDLMRDLRRLDQNDTTPLRRLGRRRSAGPSDSSVASTGSPGAARALLMPAASDTSTVIEVRSADRPRLLYDLGKALSDNGISVRSAHVATYAGQAVDTFYVTDGAGKPLGPAAAARTIGVVIDACDGS